MVGNHVHVCDMIYFMSTYFVIIAAQFIKPAMNCCYSINSFKHGSGLFNYCLQRVPDITSRQIYSQYVCKYKLKFESIYTGTVQYHHTLQCLRRKIAYLCFFHVALLKFNVTNGCHAKNLSFYIIFYLK